MPLKRVISVNIESGALIVIPDADPEIYGYSNALGSNYLDNLTGGTINITGTGFLSGATVYFGNYTATSTTVNSSTSITAVLPPTAAGTYSLFIKNSNGSIAIWPTGVFFSSKPVWTTVSGSLGTIAESATFTFFLSATSDSSIANYSVTSGSLPYNYTLNPSTGVISGEMGTYLSSRPDLAVDTTFIFDVMARDTEGQVLTRTFSILYVATIMTWTTGTNITITSGSNYILTFNATGGTNIVYSLVVGSLPLGIVLTSSTASLAGTTSITGTYIFSIKASNGIQSIVKEFTANVA
jgi:hypothetical protein